MEQDSPYKIPTDPNKAESEEDEVGAACCCLVAILLVLCVVVPMVIWLWGGALGFLPSLDNL